MGIEGYRSLVASATFVKLGRLATVIAGVICEAEFGKAAAAFGALVASPAMQAIDRCDTRERELKRKLSAQFKDSCFR